MSTKFDLLTNGTYSTLSESYKSNFTAGAPQSAEEHPWQPQLMHSII